MMPIALENQASVPPPAYHRMQARLGTALHMDALTLARLYPYQAAKASVWMKRSKRARGISTMSGLAGDR